MRTSGREKEEIWKKKFKRNSSLEYRHTTWNTQSIQAEEVCWQQRWKNTQNTPPLSPPKNQKLSTLLLLFVLMLLLVLR